MKAAEIHARLAGRWRELLIVLGIAETFLRKKSGPCPSCGGRDRFTFDDRTQRGDYFCRGCGAGDGFALVARVLRCDFATARRLVMQAAGLSDDMQRSPAAPIAAPKPSAATPAHPTWRVHDLLRSSCAVETCDEAMRYLASRHLLPLPPKHGLRAHSSAEYFHGRKRVGRFPALLAPVRDIAGAIVTLHITYIPEGRKLATHEPRKILSPLTGRVGCAVCLEPLEGDTLGVAEGVETALAASAQTAVRTWSALNAPLLSKFEPPASIKHLVIFADRDAVGFEAAARLMQRLQGRVELEIRAPQAPAKDWADVLEQDAQREAAT